MNTALLRQAILIADDLLSQYEAVVAQMDQVSGASAENDFSNLIGQANQVYEGVWEHLDTAAAELEEAGRDIGPYRELRAQYGLLGILDSESSTAVNVVGSLAIGGLATQTKMSAKANTVGAERAAEMSALLKTSSPEIDWAAARRDADAPIENISSNAGKHLVIAAAVLAAGVLTYALFS